MDMRQWGIFRLEKRGQALLELALFGTILIMLLGILINYGLRYNFEQQTKMAAFRRALKESADPDVGGQASYTIIQDKHIPSPGSPFAVGSVMAFSSGASVIRSYKLNETAEVDKPEELPRTNIQIQDRKFTFKTAGFRTKTIIVAEKAVVEDELDKYEEIYGGSNICSDKDCGAIKGGCTKQEPDPDTGDDVCVERNLTIHIIDSCEGEIINYDSCKRQCRMFTEVDFCVRECERGKLPGSDTDCEAICNQTIATPWYCGSLDSIFNFAIARNKPKAMGVQPDYTKQTYINNILNKQESQGVITTRDEINWSDTTTRKIVSIDKGSNNVQEQGVSTTVGENTTLNCTDGVCN